MLVIYFGGSATVYKDRFRTTLGDVVLRAILSCSLSCSLMCDLHSHYDQYVFFQCLTYIGITVDSIDQVGDALRQACAAQKDGKTTVIEVMTTRELGGTTKACCCCCCCSCVFVCFFWGDNLFFGFVQICSVN